MAGGGLPLVALVACRQGTGRTWSAQAMASHLRQTPSAGGGLSSRRVLVSATAWQTAQSSFAARWTRCENGCAVCATATPAIAISRRGTRNLETVESEEVKSQESQIRSRGRQNGGAPWARLRMGVVPSRARKQAVVAQTIASPCLAPDS